VKKRTYRRIPIKSVSAEQVLQKLGEHRRLVLAVDAAKTDMVAVFWDPAANREQRALHTVYWKQPNEQSALEELLTSLQRREVSIEAALEPSGSYGDCLRVLLCRLGIEVYRVSPQRTNRAAELYDGVASLHDAKSAQIVGHLHQEGMSRRWPLPSEHERTVASTIATMDMYQGERQREINRLEALLARHWPELLTLMELGSATQLTLLSEVGGPGQVAAKPEQALEVMRRTSKGMLTPEMIEPVLESARKSTGLAPIEAEVKLLQEIASRGLTTLMSYRKAARRLRVLSKHDDAARAMAPTVGEVTAAVLVHDIGSPAQFTSARAYLKAAGLNLREKSSGKYQGQLKLTKRGPSRARRYLWLAALRLLQSDQVVRAYYSQKVARSGGRKSPAVVAVMRKLAKGLHACVRAGEAFDSSKLFDVSRLAPS
jgi:transposase